VGELFAKTACDTYNQFIIARRVRWVVRLRSVFQQKAVTLLQSLFDHYTSYVQLAFKLLIRRKQGWNERELTSNDWKSYFRCNKALFICIQKNFLPEDNYYSRQFTHISHITACNISFKYLMMLILLLHFFDIRCDWLLRHELFTSSCKPIDNFLHIQQQLSPLTSSIRHSERGKKESKNLIKGWINL